jgi:hypothetical protein
MHERAGGEPLAHFGNGVSITFNPVLFKIDCMP